MARKRKKKALYEVMTKTRLKTSAGKKIEPLRRQESEKEQPSEMTSDTAVPENSAMWWRRPKLIRLNAGRIDISLPYELAIALVLGMVFLILVAFRLGQLEQKIANTAGQVQTDTEENPTVISRSEASLKPLSGERLSPAEEEFRPADTQGDHVIVLVQYYRMADLVPVREHFAQNGIETQIVQEANWYFLITKDKYQNPKTPGTDGYKAKQRIIEVGAKYEGKAPEGRETFAPNFFRDAYGKKIN